MLTCNIFEFENSLKVSFLIHKVGVILLGFLKVNFLLFTYYIKEWNVDNVDITSIITASK